MYHAAIIFIISPRELTHLDQFVKNYKYLLFKKIYKLITKLYSLNISMYSATKSCIISSRKIR